MGAIHETQFQSTAALRYVGVQVKTLSAFGYPAAKACDVLGVPESALFQADGRIDLSRVEALYTHAAQALQDPLIAARVGSRFRSPTYGKTGSIYGFCENLAEVLELNSRYQKVAIDAGAIKHVQIDEQDRVRHSLELAPYDKPHNSKHIMMMLAGAYSEAFRWLTWGTGKDLHAITLPIHAPENAKDLSDLLHSPLHFGASTLKIEFEDGTVYAPFSTHNPEKLSQRIAVLEAMLGRGAGGAAFVNSVCLSIQGALAKGQITQGVVADRMGLSERQLRVQLSDAKTNFRTLLDTERKTLFHTLHSKGERLSLIAQALGYNDQAAFNRAFKRWYGVPPSRYKAP